MNENGRKRLHELGQVSLQFRGEGGEFEGKAVARDPSGNYVMSVHLKQKRMRRKRRFNAVCGEGKIRGAQKRERGR